MGDRGNIEVDGVNLYGHGNGSLLPLILQGALARRWRWTDGSYLARIVFCCMVRGNEDGETGFGISPAGEMPDNEYPVLRVDTKAGRIYAMSEDAARARDPHSAAMASWTFEDFLRLKMSAYDPWGALAVLDK